MAKPEKCDPKTQSYILSITAKGFEPLLLTSYRETIRILRIFLYTLAVFLIEVCYIKFYTPDV
jgi:hypothetical protein